MLYITDFPTFAHYEKAVKTLASSSDSTVKAQFINALQQINKVAMSYKHVSELEHINSIYLQSKSEAEQLAAMLGKFTFDNAYATAYGKQLSFDTFEALLMMQAPARKLYVTTM